MNETSVRIEPFGTGPETPDNETAPVGDRISPVRVLFYSACYDLLIETLLKSSVIVDVFLGKGIACGADFQREAAFGKLL